MNLQDLGGLGEIVGAIATVATLIYLAIQVRANTRSNEASSVQHMLDGARDHIIIPNVNHEDVPEIMSQGLTSVEQLKPVEKIRFMWMLVEHALQLQNVLNLRNRQLLSEADYNTWLVYVGSFLRTPGGQKLWPQVAEVISQDVVKVLGAHLADEPNLPSLLDLCPVMDTRNW
jgi:hypothetical protein